MNEQELFESFNLAENNPDQGGGILYCMRYSPEKIAAYRDSVVEALRNKQIRMEEVEDGIEVLLPMEMQEGERKSVVLLLEELSVLNDASAYHAGGYGRFHSVAELKNGLLSIYVGLLKEKDLAEAYNVVDMVIPQVTGEIRIADRQNRVLSSRDRRALDDLVDFADRHAKMLNNPRGIRIFGLQG